jgi:hypothetical protein
LVIVVFVFNSLHLFLLIYLFLDFLLTLHDDLAEVLPLQVVEIDVFLGGGVLLLFVLHQQQITVYVQLFYLVGNYAVGVDGLLFGSLR